MLKKKKSKEIQFVQPEVSKEDLSKDDLQKIELLDVKEIGYCATCISEIEKEQELPDGVKLVSNFYSEDETKISFVFCAHCKDFLVVNHEGFMLECKIHLWSEASPPVPSFVEWRKNRPSKKDKHTGIIMIHANGGVGAVDTGSSAILSGHEPFGDD